MEGAKTLNLGYHAEKKQIVLFLLFTCVLFVIAAFVLYLIPFIGFSNIHPKLPYIMAAVIGIIALYLVGGALTLVFTIVLGKSLFFNRRIRGQFVRLLFPILVVIGKLIGINKGQLRRAYISINNRLVLAEAPFVKPDKLLILLPHCLQYHECTVRITGNVENCKACGECRIKDLVALSRKHRVSIAAVTGGTLARRIVKNNRPNMIIAVACDRDLASGIQDVHPIPVFGILNERPNGPCFDTNVQVALVEKALAYFLGEKAPFAGG